jgi:predicted ArsR family transcriptional regulator
VNELAKATDLTDNAVRMHLDALVQEGKVTLGKPQKGTRKPHQTYELTPLARSEFARAYEPVLAELLSALEIHLPRRRRLLLLQEIGASLGQKHKGDLLAGRAEKLQHALNILTALGGLPELGEAGNQCQIVGHSCPLSSVVALHPEACIVAESMLSAILDVPVRNACNHGEHPRCCFKFD